MSKSCPTPETIERLAFQFLEPDAVADVRAHLRECGGCRKMFDRMSGEGDVLADAAKDVPLPKVTRPATTRRRPWPIFAGAAAASVLLGVVILFAIQGSPGEQQEFASRDSITTDYADPAMGLKPDNKPSTMTATRQPPGPKPMDRRDPFSKTRPHYDLSKQKDVSGFTINPEPSKDPGKSMLPRETGDEQDFNRGMKFSKYPVNPFIQTAKLQQSTFGLDVDTASYTLIRRFLDDGRLPPEGSVRIEEVINYFKYYDRAPKGVAFGIHLEAAPSRFREGYYTLRIGIRAKDVKKAERRTARLTFIVDTSGSMSRDNRMGTVKKALNLLLDQMEEGDQIGIVAYSQSANTILEHTSDIDKIRASLAELYPRGSTNVEAGLHKGYELAGNYFKKGCINRVILLSDGVANVGKVRSDEILRKVEEHRQAGITLTTIGVGMDNYNDVLLEQLANKGNGTYHYVDSLKEAHRVFVENLTGTLQTIAMDAKVQVEFDKSVVEEYRLIGYENRHIANRDFRNDKVDAGEIGAGHNVTALYEIKLKDEFNGDDRIAKISMRYREPHSNDRTNVELSNVISAHELRADFEKASLRLQLAAIAAEFAEILRVSTHAKGHSMAAVEKEATRIAKELDQTRDAREFLALVRKAKQLRGD